VASTEIYTRSPSTRGPSAASHLHGMKRTSLFEAFIHRRRLDCSSRCPSPCVHAIAHIQFVRSAMGPPRDRLRAWHRCADRVPSSHATARCGASANHPRGTIAGVGGCSRAGNARTLRRAAPAQRDRFGAGDGIALLSVGTGKPACLPAVRHVSLPRGRRATRSPEGLVV
jgi:hypothetical protein